MLVTSPRVWSHSLEQSQGSRITAWKKIGFSSICSPQLGVEDQMSFSHLCWDVNWLGLVHGLYRWKRLLGVHECSALFDLEDTLLFQVPGPLAYKTFLLPFSLSGLCILWVEGMTYVSHLWLRAFHDSSLHSDQLWVSILTVSTEKKKFKLFWWGLRAALISGLRETDLEGSWRLPFN